MGSWLYEVALLLQRLLIFLFLRPRLYGENLFRVEEPTPQPNRL